MTRSAYAVTREYLEHVMFQEGGRLGRLGRFTVAELVDAVCARADLDAAAGDIPAVLAVLTEDVDRWADEARG